MATRRTTTKRGAKGPRKKPGPKPKPKAPPAPSHIRGDTTARRLNPGGRPTKLTSAVIERFLELLAEGLHVAHVAALVGFTHVQVTDYLRVGKHEADAGKRTIRARFHVAVREGIAALQQKELRTLTDVERIALGWDPHCKACRGKERGCGKHPQQVKLAADIARWRLVHRHPRDWHVGTVSIEAHGSDDASSSTTPAVDGADGTKAVGAAMVLYIPQRRDTFD
jgi:predicted transcriptional regulator